MSVEFLPDPQYKFVTGSGDADHEMRLADAAAKGYRVKWMAHNQDGAALGHALVVLMEKEQEQRGRY